jgi:hypothetical protein
VVDRNIPRLRLKIIRLVEAKYTDVVEIRALSCASRGVARGHAKLHSDGGSVEVLDVVNGLPGLNDGALAVVRCIKFIPAAADFTTTVHVRFELS